MLVNKKKYLWIGMTIVFLVICSKLVITKIETNKVAELRVKDTTARNLLISRVLEDNSIKGSYNFSNLNAVVTTTIDLDLQERVEKILKKYANDYTSIVIVNNKTREIAAVSGIEKKDKEQNLSIAFSATHPAASLIKIVTAAELINNSEMSADSEFKYRGRGTTLYKYQLKEKKTRWTRTIDFEKAFAYSNNVIFGKAALEYTNGIELYRMANRFGFNDDVMDIPIGKSFFGMPKDQYNLAELASGFNRTTLISPVHAAALSSYVINNSNEKIKIVKNIVIDGKEYMNEIEDVQKVMSEESQKDLKDMMIKTVKTGTARGLIKRINKRRYNLEAVEVGAKTGSIKGGVPEGKREWLTFFINEKENNYSYSIAIMNVHKKKWYHKATLIGRELIKDILKLNDQKIATLKNQVKGTIVKK